MPPHDIGPGTVIGGRYRLARQIAQGGMGSVWAADHLKLSSQVAVKIIDESALGNEELVGRFLREAQAAASLRSPHVVQTMDTGVHEDRLPYIVMELLEGETLSEALAKAGGRMSPARVAHVMTQVAKAVAKAHEAGIVHRDLKPDNVFLVQNDDEEIAKVLDFGIAKLLGPGGGDITSSNTRTGTLLGTPFYMSPEQARGNGPIDERTDLWSMAVITFQCITGTLPFASEAFGDLVIQICTDRIPRPSERCEVPQGLDAWFAKAAARLAKDRFSSAREQADALRRVLLVEEGQPPLPLDDTMEAPTDPDPAPRGAVTIPAPRPSSGTSTTIEPSPSVRGTDTVLEAGSRTLASEGAGIPQPRASAPVVTLDPPGGGLGSTTRAVISEPRPRESGRGRVLGLAAFGVVCGVAAAWIALGGKTPTPAAAPEASVSTPAREPSSRAAPPEPAPPPATSSAPPAASAPPRASAETTTKASPPPPPKKAGGGGKAKSKDDLGI